MKFAIPFQLIGRVFMNLFDTLFSNRFMKIDIYLKSGHTIKGVKVTQFGVKEDTNGEIVDFRWKLYKYSTKQISFIKTDQIESVILKTKLGLLLQSN